MLFFFFSSRRRHTRCSRDWSSDVCSSDLPPTTNMPELFRILSEELQGYLDRLAQVWSRDLAAVNAELTRLALPKVDLTARTGSPSSADLGVNYVAAPVFRLNDNGAWSWFMD